MLDLICRAILLFFAVIGMVGTLRAGIKWLCSSRKKEPYCLVSVMKMQGHQEDAELRLRDAVGRLRWIGGPEDRMVLCIDDDMDMETRAICTVLARNEEIIRICRAEDQIRDIF